MSQQIYYARPARPATTPEGTLPPRPRPCRGCREPFAPASNKRGQRYCDTCRGKGRGWQR
jgi:hypothetical protein